jgi:hypothetical protein
MRLFALIVLCALFLTSCGCVEREVVTEGVYITCPVCDEPLGVEDDCPICLEDSEDVYSEQG